MKKQTRDAIILTVALIALVVVAVITIKSMQEDQTPAPAPVQHNSTAAATPDAPEAPAGAPAATTPAASAPAASGATKTADAGPIPWIDNTRTPHIVDEVKGGRNPFVDLSLPKPTASNIKETTPKSGATRQPESPHAVNPPPPPPPPSDLQQTRIVRLNWTTPQAVAALCNKENLDVNLQTTSHPGEVKLDGYSPDFDRAVEIIKAADIQPPIPKFVLCGVIATPTQRLAVILLDGKQYSLWEGESIPEQGWVVTKITSTGVHLTKGKLSTKLSFSGGSPS